MSVVNEFDRAAKPGDPPVSRKRLAPFSLRLTRDERARLQVEAGGVALGTYIKAKVLGSAPTRMRRVGLSLDDRTALAKTLAMLGRSHLANNLNQLARAANIGTLPVTPETESELLDAIRDVREIRRLLLVALGLKPEAAP